MPKGSASPRSQQRLRVFEAYRGRGHRTNPLWLVYSVKTQQDLILPGDPDLVHWLMCLETDARIASFEYVGDGNSQTGHPIHVFCRDGTSEKHYVHSRTGVVDAQATSSSDTVKSFDEAALRPLVPFAMRWFKAISFAAALRDMKLAPARIALAQALNMSASGSVGSLFDELHGFETSIIAGLLVQLAIEGEISLDLSAQGLNVATGWSRCMGVPHVVP